jgi:hypothetical protein
VPRFAIALQVFFAKLLALLASSTGIVGARVAPWVSRRHSPVHGCGCRYYLLAQSGAVDLLASLHQAATPATCGTLRCRSASATQATGGRGAYCEEWGRSTGKNCAWLGNLGTCTSMCRSCSNGQRGNLGSCRCSEKGADAISAETVGVSTQGSHSLPPRSHRRTATGASHLAATGAMRTWRCRMKKKMQHCLVRNRRSATGA